jgi:hydrogenase nickel incorporation protein HypA/HybF
MHEFSIVHAQLNQCKEYVAKQHAERITKTVTRIGMLSGGEPDLLQMAFDTFTEGSATERRCKVRVPSPR